jgi:ribosomal protein S12 methylthiotransferase accessory factor
LELRNAVPKYAGEGTHRQIPAAQTLERIGPHLRTIGVTRVANITWLDRVGIPVYNAIVPRSDDVLSVYNGKGPTPIDAKASAVMEAVERFSAWQPRTADVIASYNDLAASGQAAIDPLTVNLETDRRYRHGMPLSWLRGYDLLNEESVLVPQCLCGYYRRFHELRCFRIATTNGLASGNCLEEAVCHALCEVIERDDWTMAELVSNRLKQAVTKRAAGAAAEAADWLEDRYPSIDLSTLPAEAQHFVELFVNAGVRITLRNTTTATGLASVAAIAVEYVGETFATAHGGHAVHPDARVAVTRALTEAAQSRAVDIQGMREDISLPDDDVEPWNRHVNRNPNVDLSQWPYRESKAQASFGALPSTPSDDVMADIRLMLDQLRACGIARAVAVDLSVSCLPAKVVRLVVPGMEAWALDQSKLGPRSSAHWNGVLRELLEVRRQRRADPSEDGHQTGAEG